VPRIPVSEGPQVRFPNVPSGGGLSPGAPSAAAAAGGPPKKYDLGLGDIGATFNEMAKVAAAREQQTQRLVAEKEIDEFLIEQTRRTDDMFTNQTEPGAKGFTDSVIAETDDRIRQQLENTPEGIRDWKAARLSEARKGIVLGAFKLETQALTEFRTDTFNKAVDMKASRVRTDANHYDQAVTETDALIGESGLSPRVQAQLRPKAQAMLAQMRFEGLNERDPRRAMAELQSGKFDPVMPAVAKDRLMDTATEKIARAEREARAEAERLEHKRKEALNQARVEYTDIVENHKASLLHGGPGDPRYRQRDVQTLWGNQSLKVLRDVAHAEEAGKVNQQIMLTTGAEDNALVRQMEQDRLTPGTTAGQFKVNEIRARALDNKYQNINKDGAGYFLAAVPSLQQELSSPDPTVRRTAIGKLTQFQLDAGVAEHDVSVLSKNQAGALVGEFMKSGDFAKAADRMQQEAERYGPAWPTALRDLAAAKLPGGMLVVATLDQPKDAQVRRQLIEGYQVGKEGLTKGLPTGTKLSHVEEAVTGQIQEFGRTFTAAGMGAQRLAELHDAAVILSLKYAGQGMSKDTAAKAAVDALYLGNYDLTDTARAPKLKGPAVEQYADTMKRQLAVGEGEIAPRRRGPNEPGNLTPEERYAAHVSDARRGTWVTNSTDDGWVLLYTDREPVMRADGKTPYGFKFTEVDSAPILPGRAPSGVVGVEGYVPGIGGPMLEQETQTAKPKPAAKP
jgi:hypothetical protein